MTFFATVIAKFLRTWYFIGLKLSQTIERMEPYWPVHLKPHSVYSRHLASTDPQENNYTIERKYPISCTTNSF